MEKKEIRENREIMKNSEAYEKYLNTTHRLGRLMTALVLLLLLAAPYLIGLFLKAVPNLPAALKAFIGVGLVYLVSCIAEYLIYVPMLGAGGSYLSFVTGNISNLKLPCAINAMEQAGVKANSEEGEVISTIAIAVSSIVTTGIIILGVILIVPLRPVLESPVLEPAFAQMIPALFGGLGAAFLARNLKISLLPLIVMTVLFITVPALNAGTVGIVVPVSVLFTVLEAWFMYKKGWV